MRRNSDHQHLFWAKAVGANHRVVRRSANCKACPLLTSMNALSRDCLEEVTSYLRNPLNNRIFAGGDAPLSKRDVYVRPLWERGPGVRGEKPTAALHYRTSRTDSHYLLGITSVVKWLSKLQTA